MFVNAILQRSVSGYSEIFLFVKINPVEKNLNQIKTCYKNNTNIVKTELTNELFFISFSKTDCTKKYICEYLSHFFSKQCYKINMC